MARSTSLLRLYTSAPNFVHQLASASSSPVAQFSSKSDINTSSSTNEENAAHQDVEGAMHRRLRSLSESAQGIPPHFKSSPITDIDILKVHDRIAQASFKNTYAKAHAEHTLPSSADKLTRQIAADVPWTGVESQHDTALRMLTDMYKPLKIPVGKPTLSALPLSGPSKLPKPKTVSDRALAAKEASQGYSLLKEKFSPGFTRMPATVEGLASLAEERIQNARSRGEFRNLPGSGKPMKQDHLDENPYLDRTGRSYL